MRACVRARARAFVCLRAIHMCVFVVLYMCVQLQGSGNLCVYFCASSSAPGGGGQWVEGFNVCVEVQILLVGVLCAASLARSTFPLPSSSVPSPVCACSCFYLALALLCVSSSPLLRLFASASHPALLHSLCLVISHDDRSAGLPSQKSASQQAPPPSKLR